MASRRHKRLPGKKGIPGTITYIRVVRLGKWFPASDPLAASMARLSILREDFMLELRGIYANSIETLDTFRCMAADVFFQKFRSDALGDSGDADHNSSQSRI